jgi:hypothetical protein
VWKILTYKTFRKPAGLSSCCWYFSPCLDSLPLSFILICWLFTHSGKLFRLFYLIHLRETPNSLYKGRVSPWPVHSSTTVFSCLTFFLRFSATRTAQSHRRFIPLIIADINRLSQQSVRAKIDAMSRAHSFPRAEEFRAEPRNLPSATEFTYFRGISQKMAKWPCKTE